MGPERTGFGGYRTQKAGKPRKLALILKAGFSYMHNHTINAYIFRGPIKDFETCASHGQVVISPDKSSLDWNLGNIFFFLQFHVEIERASSSG